MDHVIPWMWVGGAALPLLTLAFFIVRDVRRSRKNTTARQVADPLPTPTATQGRTVTHQIADLGDDPLDPHGDGTIRPGNPVYDLMMRSMKDDTAMLANRREDGMWDVEHH